MTGDDAREGLDEVPGVDGVAPRPSRGPAARETLLRATGSVLGGLLLVLSFVDIGLAQNAMFDAAPPAWGRYLPAHAAVRVMMDSAFTTTFDETGSLTLALAWLATLGALAVAVFRRTSTVGSSASR